jgi:predicted transcriptional regulator
MIDRGWMKSYENPSGNKGRPFKAYEPALPMPKNMDSIEREKTRDKRSFGSR